MAWKEDVIKVRTEKLSAPPQDIFELQDTDDYTKVSARGILLHDMTQFVGPRPRSIQGQGVQAGYLAITPVYDPARKAAVLVNRGWVPATWRGSTQALAAAHDAAPAGPSGAGGAEPASGSPQQQQQASSQGGGWFGRGRGGAAAAAAAGPRGKGQAPGAPGPTVEVTGLIMPSENPSAAVPDNKPGAGEWHWLDVPELARACGLPPDTPMILATTEDAAAVQQMRAVSPLESRRTIGLEPAGGAPQFPVAKHTGDLVRFPTMPTDHAIYAMTWVALCLALGYMARQAVFFPRRHSKIINNEAVWAARGGVKQDAAA